MLTNGEKALSMAKFSTAELTVISIGKPIERFSIWKSSPTRIPTWFSDQLICT